jgi:glycosyltransferase involved in cell wall biosynthesis
VPAELGSAETRPGRRSEPIRVAYYCDSAEIGGAEISLGNLLAALGTRVRPIVIATHAEVIERLTAGGADVAAELVPQIHRKRDLAAIGAHFGVFRRLRPDIAHVVLNNPWASHWGVIAALSTRGSRTIAVEQLVLPAARRKNVWLKRMLTPRLAAHVAVGVRAAREIESLAGLRAGSIRTIHNGIPDVELEPLPRPVEGPIVGSIGRLERQKGYDTLLRTLPELPGVTAVIVGEGTQRERLVALADELGVADRVLLPGWSDEARRHLTTFDVFCLPSRFEAFPLAVLEAMLAGLPIVASDVGSVSEAVREGETGLLVRPDDPVGLAAALRELVGDAGRRGALGAAARRLALERFTVEAMARAYELLYDEILGARGA